MKLEGRGIREVARESSKKLQTMGTSEVTMEGTSEVTMEGNK